MKTKHSALGGMCTCWISGSNGLRVDCDVHGHWEPDDKDESN